MVIPKSFRLAFPTLAVLACNGGDLVLPGDGEPASIQIVQGNGQSARVGELLPQPILVRVTDAAGRPVVGAAVALELLDPGPQTDVEPDTGHTGPEGIASFQVRLGTRIGAQNGAARLAVPEGASDLDAPFSLTALSAQANGLAMVSGDNQSAPAGQALAEPLVVEVTDQFGNPIPGMSIHWLAEGGGSVSASETQTDEAGRASVERTLGSTVGTQEATASAEGLAGSPATFTHTALAGNAARLEVVGGNGQSAVVGTRVPDELAVRVLDGNDNPVPGTAMTWVIGVGEGSVAPESSPTDVDGISRTTWTLGPQPGTNTVSAVVSGVGVAEFTAQGVPGTPPGMAVITQPSATARRGVSLERPPVIQLKDPGGADLRQGGVVVSVAVRGGARLRGTLSRPTTAEGRASFGDLTLEGPPGRYTLAFSANGFTGAVSDGITLSKARTSISITSDTPEPSAPGAEVRVAFSVQSEGGTPPGSVAVGSDDGSSCSGTVAAASCVLRPQQSGSRTLTATYPGNEEFEASSDTERHEVEAPPPPPPPPVLVIREQPSSSALVGVPFRRQPEVGLAQAGGGALRQAGVQITATIESGGGTLLGATTLATNEDGRARFTDLAIAGAPGTRTLRFSASGFVGVVSNSIAVQTVPAEPTETRIEDDNPDPSRPGEAVTVEFRVRPREATGTVTITAAGSGESCSAQLEEGEGECILNFTEAGEPTLTATYAGNDAFAPSSDTESHRVRDEGSEDIRPTAAPDQFQTLEGGDRQ
jgi:Bacterial Ig-like domain (group 3)/Bacterial Ig-like domain (group 1)